MNKRQYYLYKQAFQQITNKFYSPDWGDYASHYYSWWAGPQWNIYKDNIKELFDQYRATTDPTAKATIKNRLDRWIADINSMDPGFINQIDKYVPGLLDYTNNGKEYSNPYAGALGKDGINNVADLRKKSFDSIRGALRSNPQLLQAIRAYQANPTDPKLKAELQNMYNNSSFEGMTVGQLIQRHQQMFPDDDLSNIGENLYKNEPGINAGTVAYDNNTIGKEVSALATGQGIYNNMYTGPKFDPNQTTTSTAASTTTKPDENLDKYDQTLEQKAKSIANATKVNDTPPSTYSEPATTTVSTPTYTPPQLARLKVQAPAIPGITTPYTMHASAQPTQPQKPVGPQRKMYDPSRPAPGTGYINGKYVVSKYLRDRGINPPEPGTNGEAKPYMYNGVLYSPNTGRPTGPGNTVNVGSNPNA